MRILIICNHYPVASGRYILNALKRLGHDVRSTGVAMGTAVWGLNVNARYVWVPEEMHIEPNGVSVGSDGWQPEAVIVADSDPAILDSVSHARQVMGDIPVVVWGVDNHVRAYRRPNFDHYFLAHYGVSVEPWGADDMTWLPCGYDPEWFMPSTIAWHDRQYDVAMVGVMYPNRQLALDLLQKAGLRVVGVTGPVYDQFRQFYAHSRISLCISARQDLAQRIFETAAIGCAILSDPVADWQAMRVPGEMVTEPESLVMAAHRLLAAGPAAGAEAKLWALPHTWDNRAKVVIEWLTTRSNQSVE